jgi:hypothetical protein
MKFQIAKSDLVAAFQMVSEGVASSGNEIYTHLLFRVSPTDSSKIEMLANSVRTCAICPLSAATLLEGGEPFTVEASRMEKWLSAVKDSALTVEFVNKVVTITVPGQGIQKFQSLDPAGFSYFDKLYASAKLTATVKASKLKEALQTAKLFAGNPSVDTKSPEICTVEVQNGVLVSTDKASSVCFVTLSELKDSGLRVHIKDLGGVTKFLGLLGEGDVELLDQDRINFFRGAGAVFGAGKIQQGPPNVKVPVDQPHYRWKCSRQEMKDQVKFLLPGMPKDVSRVSLDRKGGPILLTAQSVTGEAITVEVTCLEAVEAPGAPPVPVGGVPIVYERLLYLLDSLEEDEVSLGVSIPNPQKQFIRVSETHEDVDYVLVLAARHY